MLQASSLPDRYRVGKTQFYQRRDYLIKLGYNMEPTKRGRNSFYSDEQVQLLDNLHDYYRNNGTFDGFPPAAIKVSGSQPGTDTSLTLDNGEAGLVARQGELELNESIETEEIYVDTKVERQGREVTRDG
jgi:hypothetical protein